MDNLDYYELNFRLELVALNLSNTSAYYTCYFDSAVDILEPLEPDDTELIDYGDKYITHEEYQTLRQIDAIVKLRELEELFKDECK